MAARTHDELVAAYRRRPGLAADAAERHRLLAVAAQRNDEPKHAVHHWDRVDAYHAVLDELEHCRRCGRPLINPESVARRIGPECWAKERTPERCTICGGAGTIAAPDPILGGTVDIDCVCAAATQEVPLPGIAQDKADHSA